jgi:hypothetical protein
MTEKERLEKRTVAADQMRTHFDTLHKIIIRQLTSMEFDRILRAPSLDALSPDDRTLFEEIWFILLSASAFMMDEYTLLRMLKSYTLGSQVITYSGDQHSNAQLYMLRKLGFKVLASHGYDSTLVSDDPEIFVKNLLNSLIYTMLKARKTHPGCVDIEQSHSGPPPFYAPFFPHIVNRDMAIIAALLQSPTKWAFDMEELEQQSPVLQLLQRHPSVSRRTFDPLTQTIYVEGHTDTLSLIELFNAPNAAELIRPQQAGSAHLRAFAYRSGKHMLVAFPKSRMVCFYENFVSTNLTLISSIPSVFAQWLVLEPSTTSYSAHSLALGMIQRVATAQGWTTQYGITYNG